MNAVEISPRAIQRDTSSSLGSSNAPWTHQKKYVVVSTKEQIVYGPFETIVTADVVSMRLRAAGPRPIEPWTDDRLEQCSDPPVDQFSRITRDDAKALLRNLDGSKKLG